VSSIRLMSLISIVLGFSYYKYYTIPIAIGELNGFIGIFYRSSMFTLSVLTGFIGNRWRIEPIE
ncbi:MAG: hypothetical protein N2506_07740, partial [Dehalococcoidales bacterium]|nr:hypothetical protein [Dehalococcoidales bacterium]